MSLALYRLYRPKRLSDLLGQESTVTILKNAAREGALAHAYLFYGPRGTGKTTAARLVAKIANCEKRAMDKAFHAEGEPCNACRVCKEIDTGSALDVIEIDAASNRGIDEIRNLKELAHTAPASYARKVFILDEVHMLNKFAFNALLKTLEEPPAHAMLILATTEHEGLPATITSRAQRFAFKKLDKKSIMEKLTTICAAEHISAEPAALEAIAVAAEGSLRDAESLLDQVRTHSPALTADAVERTLGRVGWKRLHEFAALLAARDAKQALAYVHELEATGVNLAQFTKDTVHYFRRTLSLKLNPELATLFERELTAEDIAGLKKIGTMADSAFFSSFISSLIRAYTDMRYSPFAAAALEVAIVEKIE